MTNLSHLKTLLELARGAVPGPWVDSICQMQARGTDQLIPCVYVDNGSYDEVCAFNERARDVGTGEAPFPTVGPTGRYIVAMSPDRIIPALEEAIAAMERDSKEKAALAEMSRLAQETGEYD